MEAKSQKGEILAQVRQKKHVFGAFFLVKRLKKVLLLGTGVPAWDRGGWVEK